MAPDTGTHIVYDFHANGTQICDQAVILVVSKLVHLARADVQKHSELL